MGFKISIEELNERLSWTLHQKVDHALYTIENAISKKDCYVSYSGGKDSTVLLYLARLIKPDVKAVFFNTTNEFPEIYRFIKSQKNVEWINPDYSLKQVIEKCGFPLISKEQAKYIREARHTNSQKLLNQRLYGRIGKKYQGKIALKWQHLLEAPFEISEKCCYYLKKKPALAFNNKTRLIPIIGVQATESSLRKQDYLNTGCNSFDEKNPRSKPLSIFTDKDIWEFIKLYNIPYCEIYDKGETQTGCMICGFGCHLDDRFWRLQETYPKVFDNGMNIKNNGISYEQAILTALKKTNVRGQKINYVQTELMFIK
jgi:3'-phosphoadenosine 5'-phosphosulfate sulfotransferase (PAPS reductase)/FAD synthetase